MDRGPRAWRQPLPQLSIAELSPARPWVSWKHCVCPESPDGLPWEGLKVLTWFTPLDDVIAVWFSISASGLMDRAVHREPCLASQEAQLLPPQMSEPLVSEGDAQELRQILRKLKSLALDTETELERQDEALDGITAAVDRTTLTIDKHTRRAKKLT